jgi:UDP-glucose 4-epimerase
VILVTGGAGYIGSHTVRALRKAGYEPLIFDDFSTGHRDFVEETPLVVGSLLNTSDIAAVFDRFDIDGVIHFAGKALVPESETDPGIYFQTNVCGGVNLLNAMKRRGVGRIIFSSTCATYGIPDTQDISEDHPQRPINAYGESKLAFEWALERFRLAHGIEYLSLRYFNAAGAEPGGRIGEDHDPETHLIPLVLGAACGLRPEVQILGTDYPTPDGTCVRDYVHVDDLAEAHVSGLERLLQGRIQSQGLNLGTGRGASVREIIDLARQVTRRDFRVVERPRRKGDPPRLVAVPDRAKACLDWNPRASDLGHIVETAWQWLLKRRGIPTSAN